MKISIRRKDRVVILDLCGRIDENAADFIETVGLCVRSKQCDILCNFEEVEFVDYMGISAIVLAYKEVINYDGRMKFVNVPTHIKGIFSISGLDKTFEFYTTEEAALNAFREDKVIEKIRKKKLRRRFKRLPIDIKVNFKKNIEGNQWHQGQVLDLSAQGAYIYGYNHYALGDTLELTLNISSKLEDLELGAVVVWLSDKQVQPQYHPGMGVEFHNISSEIQKKVLEFIDKNMASISKDKEDVL